MPTRTELAPSDELDRLVRDHLPLVGYAVAELAARVPRHVARDELVSAGMLGLTQAARTFDAGRGLSFDKYAKSRIRGALLDELRSRDWASRGVRALARRVDVARDDLQLALGRVPTRAELAEALGVTASALAQLDADLARASVLHLDLELDEAGLPVTEGDERPEQALLDQELRGYLRDAVLELPERLQAVVVGYFFHERQMQDLAAELQVTESRVSQMCSEALALLRNAMNAHLAPELVDADPRPEGRSAKRKAAYYAAVGSRSRPLGRVDGVQLSTLLPLAG